MSSQENIPRLEKLLLNVNDNISRANGLSNEFYISKEIYELEKSQLLYKNWCGLGFGKDVPNVGDIKAISFLGLPLIVVRTSKTEINVFENVCRHRGMILINEDKKNKKNIRCPYHNWCYGLDGSLESTPHVGGIGNHHHEDLITSDLGLNKIRSYVWHDIIFVNIADDADHFCEHYSELIDRWKDFDLPLFYGGNNSSFSLELNANWKLAVENYCESYHLPSVHPDLNKTSKLQDHYDICNARNFSGQGSYYYRQLSDEKGNVFPDFEDLPHKWDKETEYIALYPNVLMGVHRDLFFAVILIPESAKKTLEQAAFYFADDIKNNNSLINLITQNKLFWKTIFEEDISVVEGMQKGRQGRSFDGGKFSPVMDVATHNFHKWVAEELLKSNSFK